MRSELTSKHVYVRGWKHVRLADLGDGENAFADGPFGSNLKTEHYRPTGARVVRLQNIGNGYFLDGDKAFVELDHYENLKRHHVVPGDVVVAALGDGRRPAGRACIVPGDIGPAIVKADCFRVRLRDDLVYGPFLVLAMNGPTFLSQVSEQIRGATRPRMTLKILRDCVIPLPSLGEQKRIAALLNEQMAMLNGAREAQDECLVIAAALSTSYLQSVFPAELGNAVSMPSGWRQVPLGNASELVSGVTVGRQLREPTIRRVPYLRVANVKDGYLDLFEIKHIDVTEAELRKWRLRDGDILLTEGGDLDKLGRGTFWSEQIPDCIHQNHIFRVRFDRSEVYPPFAAAQLGSPYGKKYFLRHAKKTTGIASINQKVLRSFPLILPPINEQLRIAEKLLSQQAAAAAMAAEMRNESEALARLPAALLRRAFSGSV